MTLNKCTKALKHTRERDVITFVLHNNNIDCNLQKLSCACYMLTLLFHFKSLMGTPLWVPYCGYPTVGTSLWVPHCGFHNKKHLHFHCATFSSSGVGAVKVPVHVKVHCSGLSILIKEAEGGAFYGIKKYSSQPKLSNFYLYNTGNYSMRVNFNAISQKWTVLEFQNLSSPNFLAITLKISGYVLGTNLKVYSGQIFYLGL